MTPASRVLVFMVPAHATGPVQAYEALTNAQGEWSLSSITPGEYSVLMIVVPASGTRETRTTQTVALAEGQSLSLGTVDIGTPAVSEARTEAEIIAEGTLTVTVTTAEGLPANGAVLTIQGSIGGGSATVPTGGVVTEKVRNGPATLSVTDTPPDSATQVSATAQATITANTTTAVTLTLPAGTPLALPAGIAASNSERDLGYLNAERARWDLPAVITLNSAWSQACSAHDTYLADNKRLEHPEDTSLPGASPAGAWAGLHSILAGGSDWTAQGNPWEDAPIHLNQLYTPDLDVVGIDESRDTCTTTWPGIGTSLQPGGTIITYPGDGTTGFPPAELAAESPFVPGKFVGLPEGTIAGRELFVYEEHGACSLLACLGPIAPDIESATLTGPNGPVEVRTVSGNTNELGGYLTGAIVIPVKPLEANATYTAEVALAPYGELPAERHGWSFHTGPANPDGAWPRSTRGSSPRSVSNHAARISKLRVAPAAFPTVQGRRHATAALVTYLDSANGTVNFTVYRVTFGVITGGRCEAPKANAAHKRRCTRYTRVYTIKHHDRTGKNSFRLTGRYGHRRLAPGRYRLAAIGSPANATFTITR